MVSVLLLGRPQLLADGKPLDVPRRKSRAVAYYLAARGGPVAREQLLPLFWPDLDRQSAQQTLRATIYGLRKALGASLVVADDALSLAPEVEVDAARFESVVSDAEADPEALAAAIALYRGDFLEGFVVPDAPDFDEWASAERDRLRQLRLRGLGELAEGLERRGDLSAALETVDRALAVEPLREDLQRVALRVQHSLGDRVGAVRRYERLRRLLDDELGVPPMPETRALYDAIVGDDLPAVSPARPGGRRAGPRQPASPSAPRPAAMPFAGRVAELEKLHELMASGESQLALVSGAPGIGKTRLADELIERERRREPSTLALTGVAHELDRAIPYQPIVEAIRGLLASPEWPRLRAEIAYHLAPTWRDEFSRLLPEAGESRAGSRAQPADEWRLWEAVNQLLLALARTGPTIVFLDDLQWADSSTLRLIGYLLRQSTGAPVRFLATTRPYELRSPVATLVRALEREGRILSLRLDRLDAGAVESLARALSPGYAHALASWLETTAEGNPYVLAELIRHARENGLLRADGVVNLNALSAAPIVPQTVYGLIQARLARLSDAARRLLDAAVAAGREFDLDVASQAAGLAEESALDALDELRAAGLVRPLAGARYSFDHNLTLEVAYREVGEPRHRLLHRRVAEAIESQHQDDVETVAGLLAWHFAEGNAPERAAPYALRAGYQAMRLAAWVEAARFFEQALAATTADTRLPILMALGEARQRAGDSGRATEAFCEALDLAVARGDPASVGSARLAIARAYLTQARYAEAVALASEVRESGLDSSAFAAEFAWGTALSLEGADLVAAASHLRAAESLTMAASPVDQASLAEVEFELGSVAAQRGDLRQAVDLYRRSLAAAESAPDPEAALVRLALAHNNLAYHLHLLGEPSEAAEHAERGLKIAREKGLVGLLPYLLSTTGEIALARGDLAAAERSFDEGLDVARRVGMPERVAGITANLGLLAIERGQREVAVERLTSALEQADDLGIRHLAAQVRIWLGPLLPPTEARARLAEAREIAEGGGRQRLLDEVARLDQTL